MRRRRILGRRSAIGDSLHSLCRRALEMRKHIVWLATVPFLLLLSISFGSITTGVVTVDSQTLAMVKGGNPCTTTVTASEYEVCQICVGCAAGCGVCLCDTSTKSTLLCGVYVGGGCSECTVANNGACPGIRKRYCTPGCTDFFDNFGDCNSIAPVFTVEAWTPCDPDCLP